MEIAICVLAWIGLAVATGLSVFTLIVWSARAWHAVLKAAVDGVGLFHASCFYLTYRVLYREEASAASLLLYGFKRLAKENPALADEFRRLINVAEE